MWSRAAQAFVLTSLLVCALESGGPAGRAAAAGLEGLDEEIPSSSRPLLEEEAPDDHDSAAEEPPSPWRRVYEFCFPRENLSGRGLLELRDPFPLALLHLQLPVNTLERLKQDQRQLEVGLHWANNFSLADTFVVDTEVYQAEVGGWYALADDFYLGANLSLHARGGGILDASIEHFHERFAFRSANRDLRERNAYEISIIDEDGNRHSLKRGVGLGDLTVKSHWLLNRGGRFFPAVAMQTFVNLPTSSAGFGSDGLDLGVSLSYYKRVFEVVYLYGSIGAVYLTSTELEGIRFEKIGYQASGGFEIKVLDSLSLVFQAMVYSPLLEGPSPLDERRNYVAGGLKWEIFNGTEATLSFIENLEPFENTADIALAVGLDFNF